MAILSNTLYTVFNRIVPAKFILFSVVLVLTLVTCNKDDDDEDQAAKIEISQWIYDWMKDVYFWNETLPTVVDIRKKTDPEAFFYELVYEPEDSWSYITDDYASLSAEFSGTPVSMGYSPAFGLFSNTNKVFIIVEYVYPNSPASKAGLKRGDIILTINGETMDTGNYYDLYSQNSYTAGLGMYANNTIYDAGRSITLTATTITADPLIYDTIFSIADKKIGYMVYTGFITGDNNEFLATLDLAFDRFKNGNVTDLIVDLRYNPGGQIDASVHLASNIAPAGVANGSNTFVTFLYNSLLQSYLEKEEGPDSENLICKLPASAHNINLSRVYFLTTYYTASASELLIIGLKPYMDVTVIGEWTYGKYTGSWLIYDFDTPPKHNWAMMPIVIKYANAQGYTDFRNGLQPDQEMQDNIIEAKPFGSTEDPMLATAIEAVTGTSLKSTRSVEKPGYRQLDNKLKKLKRNLFVNNTELLNLQHQK
ncbi:MAG: PDZ domain-containing protein [Bacteroidales bacterium]|nr:PDZ domain-containing protein [Bacteroidales bacterium]